DVLEVMNRFDFLPEVNVFCKEAGPLAFHQDAVGDVEEHGSRVFAARFRLGPDFDPDRFAVIFAAQLDNNTSGLLAADLDRELLAGQALGVGPVGDERQAYNSGHLFLLDAQYSLGSTVGADKPRLKVFFDVSERGFLVQVPQALLAFAKL